MTDGRPGFYPPPEPRIRVLGIAAIAGGLLWPLALLQFATTVGATCGPAGCQFSLEASVLLALSTVLIAIGAAGLDLRPRPPIGLLDLIGDMTLGVSGGLFVIASLLAAPVFLGSAFLLLLIGGIVFGVEGFRGAARPRLPSAIVAVGAGAMIAFAILGGIAGPGGAGGFDQTVILGILLFAVGWVWLGADLLLGRPVPIRARPEDV